MRNPGALPLPVPTMARMPGLARAPINPAVMRPTPAPWRGAPGGCNMPISLLSEAYEYLVIGTANPYLTRWVPASTELNIGGTIRPAGEILALGRTIPILDGSDAIHPGDGGIFSPGPTLWHHVSIGVTSDVIYPTDAPITNPEQIPGNRATLLKARITMMMGNSRTRSFDFDIDSGVEFDVRCKSIVGITALVPDPTAIPTFTPPELIGQSFQFATTVVVTILCASTPQGYKNPLRYSQAFFTQGEDPVLMPIFRDTDEVLLMTDTPDASSGSVDGTFIYAYESPLLAGGPIPTIFSPLGTITSAPGVTQVRDKKAGNANGILAGHAAAPARINVIQLLNI